MSFGFEGPGLFGGGGALAISPTSTEVDSGQSVTFVGSGGTGGYTYAFVTNHSGGTINGATGVYVAGRSAGVTDTVKVTDSSLATATATIVVDPALTIAPTSVTVLALDSSETFSASGGPMGGIYTFSLLVNNSGGSINSSTGHYTSGATTGVSDTIRVTDGNGNHADAIATVNPPVSIAPTADTVSVGGTHTFAGVNGTTPYVFSITVNNSGGSINISTGVYTAGPVAGTSDTVQVRDYEGGTATATVTIPPFTISPTSVTLTPLGTQTFTTANGAAPVAFSFDTNASGGTINPSTGAYVAGRTGSVTDYVLAQDVDFNGAIAAVTVTAGVSISPTTASMAPGGTQTFSASGGTGTGFVFSFVTNNSGGSINSSTGAYIAGPHAGSPDLITVTDSVGNVAADGSGNAVVTIPGVSASPSTVTLPPGGTQTFSASGGSGTGFTYSLSLDNSGGSVNSSTGVYVAGSTGGGAGHVTATDGLGNTGIAIVTVSPSLAISPTSISKPPLGHQTFSASGGSGTGFVFAFVYNNSGGSISSSTGAYIAGSTGGVTDTVSVTDSLSDTAQATVSVGPSLAIFPTTLDINISLSHTFTYTGGSGTGITFSLIQNHSGGSIDGSTGVYTAGSTGSVTDIVQVADSLGNTATSTVNVFAPPTPNFFVQGVTLIGLSTIRVRYTYPPRAVDPDALNDALHPANYKLSGNDITYVIAVIPVSGDDRSFDCLMAAPLGFGKWTLAVSNVVSEDGGQTL